MSIILLILLVPIIHSQIAFKHIYHPLIYKTDLKHINEKIDKIKKQNRAKIEPYNKSFLWWKSIYEIEETPYCLLQDTAFFN